MEQGWGFGEANAEIERDTHTLLHIDDDGAAAALAKLSLRESRTNRKSVTEV